MASSFTQIGGDYGSPYTEGGFFKKDDNGDWWYWGEPEDGFILVWRGSAPNDSDTMAPWIKWPDVLSTMGAQEIPEDQYERLRMIGSYYGWYNLDSCPESYTEAELKTIIEG